MTLRRRPTKSTRRNPKSQTSTLPIHLLLLISLSLAGCSVKGMAINSLANALSGKEGGSNVYLTDNDPILVGEALPFSLKLMETVLQEAPEHEGLLVAAATGFVSYAEMWVLRPSKYMEDTDFYAARAERLRAKALFLRAGDYAGRALELRHPGILSRLVHSPDSAVLELRVDDLPATYWYTAALGRAITTDLGDAALLVQGRTVKALLDRGLDMDEAWGKGAFHELYMGVPAQLGGSPEVAEAHFARAMELNQGTSVGPMVSLAEAVYKPRQDREGYTTVLNEVLAFDPDLHRETRLTNILAQQYAQWLLSKTDEFFWTDTEDRGQVSKTNNMRFPWPLHF